MRSCFILNIAFALLWLILCMPAAKADIYAFTDEDGTPHFSNAPADPRYTLFERSDQMAPLPVSVTIPVVIAFNAANSEKIKAEVEQAALAYQVDAALLHAVIAAESGYNPRAVSGKGAKGLMQLMPATARRFGVSDPFDSVQNIRGGAQYLHHLLAQFGNNLQLAIAAFNAGENNVIKYGNRIPPFRETVAYVPKVIGLYQGYKQRLVAQP